jgi:hypothetical protein
MQAWSARAFANIDLATRNVTIVRPSETLLRGHFDVASLTPEQTAYCREHFAEEHLPREQWQPAAVDALALEVHDFIGAVRTNRPPRVTGDAGRDALAVAEQILSRIHAGANEGVRQGGWGPPTIAGRQTIPSPHFGLTTAKQDPKRLAKAG